MTSPFDGILKLKDIFNKTCKLDYKHHVLKLSSFLFENRYCRCNEGRTNWLFDLDDPNFTKRPLPNSENNEGFMGTLVYTFPTGEAPGPIEKASSCNITTSAGELIQSGRLMFGESAIYTYPSMVKVKDVPNIAEDLCSWPDYSNYYNYQMMNLGVYQGVGYAIQGAHTNAIKTIKAKTYDYENDTVNEEEISVSDVYFDNYIDQTGTGHKEVRYLKTQEFDKTLGNRLCLSTLPSSSKKGVKYYEIRRIDGVRFFGDFQCYFKYDDVSQTTIFYDTLPLEEGGGYPDDIRYEYTQSGSVTFEWEDCYCHYNPFSPILLSAGSLSIPIGAAEQCIIFAKITDGNSTQEGTLASDISPGINVEIPHDRDFSPDVGDLVTISGSTSEDVIVTSIISTEIFRADRVNLSHETGSSLALENKNKEQLNEGLSAGDDVLIQVSNTFDLEIGSSVKVWSRSSSDNEIYAESAIVTKVVTNVSITVDRLEYNHEDSGWVGSNIKIVDIEMDYNANTNFPGQYIPNEKEFPIAHIEFFLGPVEDTSFPDAQRIYNGWVCDTNFADESTEPPATVDSTGAGWSWGASGRVTIGPAADRLDIIEHFWDGSGRRLKTEEIWSDFLDENGNMIGAAMEPDLTLWTNMYDQLTIFELERAVWQFRGGERRITDFEIIPKTSETFDVLTSISEGDALTLPGYATFPYDFQYTEHQAYLQKGSPGDGYGSATIDPDDVVYFERFGDTTYKALSIPADGAFTVSGEDYPFLDRVPSDIMGNFYTQFYDNDYNQTANSLLRVDMDPSLNNLPSGQIGLTVYDTNLALVWSEAIDIPFTLTSNNYFRDYTTKWKKNLTTGLWTTWTDYENWKVVAGKNYYFVYETTEPANRNIGVLGFDLEERKCIYWYQETLDVSADGYEQTFTNNLYTGTNVVINIPDTSGYVVNEQVKIWDGTLGPAEDPLAELGWIKAVDPNVSVTVAALSNDHEAGGKIDVVTSLYPLYQKLWHYESQMAFSSGKTVNGAPPTSKGIWKVVR